MSSVPLNGVEQDLFAKVVEACQAGIAHALADPSEALGFAKALDAALSTLRLVESETSRGEAGAPYVAANAEAMTRSALSDVLRYSPDPERAREALARAPSVAPRRPEAETKADSGERAARAGRPLPTFAEISEIYINVRIKADGAGHPDIPYLRLRRDTFIDLIGDRLVNEYYPSDLQDYVNKMQTWPANVTKRSAYEGLSTQEILTANKALALAPLKRKTMSEGYLANVKTMMRWGMADYSYRDPFAGARIHWPKIYLESTPREDVAADVLKKLFQLGVETGRLVDAMLPLLARLTGRRLALLIFLRGEHFRMKDGAPIAQIAGLVFVKGKWIATPIKTGGALGFFALHEFLLEIGFFDWARRQEGWIFKEAHEYPDPSKWASKTMARLFKKAGAKGGVEVFHSFRGDAIDALRDAKVQGRAARLQAGHALVDEHDKYGHRALSAGERQQVKTAPLPEGVDWSIFSGLDFDALAAARTRREGGGKGKVATPAADMTSGAKSSADRRRKRRKPKASRREMAERRPS